MFFLPDKFPVTCHTDFVGKGSTFVAINGFKNKGSEFVDLAIKKGATRIILESGEDLSSWQYKYPDIKFEVFSNARKALALLSRDSLSNPASSLKIIGITGTKGKTTTSFLVEYILKSLGYKTALLGTIKNKIGDKEIQSSRTTMGADWLHMFFDQCKKEQVDFVVMEVSSHALSLDRTYGIKFDVACFTNLASEHMDYYHSLEDYFNAKAILFDQVKDGGNVIINSDDHWGRRLVNKMQNKRVNLIEIKEQGDNPVFKIQQNTLDGLSIQIKSDDREDILISKLLGSFNAYNLVMAFWVCMSLGIEKSLIIKALGDFSGVPGRLQRHDLKNGAIAFVDYAHNPSSFEVVLKNLRGVSDDLIVLFGCGGDRDKSKRPMMGKIASFYGDKIILAEDNSRSEDSNSIVDDILGGISDSKRKDVCVCLDRKDAIRKAAEFSKKNSVIALLGKGHENYHIVKEEVKYFDDFDEISQF